MKIEVYYIVLTVNDIPSFSPKRLFKKDPAVFIVVGKVRINELTKFCERKHLFQKNSLVYQKWNFTATINEINEYS